MRSDRYQSKVKCTHPHYCYDWDSMFITPLMPEFGSCTCKCSGEGATSQKDFFELDPLERKWLQEWLDHEKEKQEEEMSKTVSA